MFTGIVEERGRISTVEPLGDSVRVVIAAAEVLEGTRLGDSIAVNGVCLTVVDCDGNSFSADVMQETLDRSSLGAATAGAHVNLERAARLDSRIGGHLVQGHVDGTGSVLAIEPSDHWTVMRFSLPQEIARYVVEKGSITVDGVSLTVVDAQRDWFSVSLIPTTLQMTTLGDRKVGDRVNLEVDAIAKYGERLLEWRDA
ncbi:MAG: riboflavin synthase [Candidatus Nanopelagicales bacterium]|nr:riboflavin synthase [Candidatus Nanopelagicales bacterium]